MILMITTIMIIKPIYIYIYTHIHTDTYERRPRGQARTMAGKHEWSVKATETGAKAPVPFIE